MDDDDYFLKAADSRRRRDTIPDRTAFRDSTDFPSRDDDDLPSTSSVSTVRPYAAEPTRSGIFGAIQTALYYVVIAAVIVGGFVFINRTYESVVISSRLSHEITDGFAQHAQAGWLALNNQYVLGYLRSVPNIAPSRKGYPAGMWTYRLSGASGGDWWGGLASTETIDSVGVIRKEQSLGTLWLQELFRRGYFREAKDRPPSISIKEFTITSPDGRSWHVRGKPASVRSLFNLGVMLNCKEYQGQMHELMELPHNSIGYAIAFSALNERLSLDEKVRLSCDKNPNTRLIAAEMLTACLPFFPLVVPVNQDVGIDPRVYQDAVERLSAQMSIPQKRSLFQHMLTSDGADSSVTPE